MLDGQRAEEWKGGEQKEVGKGWREEKISGDRNSKDGEKKRTEEGWRIGGEESEREGLGGEKGEETEAEM